MELFKLKAIHGLQMMYRLRYKAIKAGKWWPSHSHGNFDLGKYGKRNKIMREYKRTVSKRQPTMYDSIFRNMVYRDLQTSTDFKVVVEREKTEQHFKQGESFAYQINKIRDTTTQFLMRTVVDKLNEMFTPDICLKYFHCNCPDPITENDIVTDYPKSCYGDENCLNPAGLFGENYHWCWLKENENDKDWKKVNKVDMDTCMALPMPIYEKLNELKRR